MCWCIRMYMYLFICLIMYVYKYSYMYRYNYTYKCIVSLGKSKREKGWLGCSPHLSPPAGKA